MLERDGLNTSVANAKYFGETLPALATERLAGGADRERSLADLRDACQDAAAAYQHFRTFHRDDVLRTGESDEGQGGVSRTIATRWAKTEYNWALQNNFHLDKTAQQLFDEAWPIVEATQTADDRPGATDRRSSRNWTLPADGPAAVRAVFDELSKDYPKSDDEMISWYRERGVPTRRLRAQNRTLRRAGRLQARGRPDAAAARVVDRWSVVLSGAAVQEQRASDGST